MKLVIYFISIIIFFNKTDCLTKDSLKSTIESHLNEETLWIEGPLAESIENKIFIEMAEDARWKEVLKEWNPLTFKDYRGVIHLLGFSILHSEIERKIVQTPLSEWFFLFDLPAQDREAFWSDFNTRFFKTKGGIHKKIRLYIRKKSNNEHTYEESAHKSENDSHPHPSLSAF